MYKIKATTFVKSEDAVKFDSIDPVTRKYHSNSKFIHCLIIPLAIFGSFFFSVFGGAGLALFPIKLISKYIYRPKKPNAEEYVLAKKVLLKMSQELIEKGQTAYDNKMNIQQNKQLYKIQKKILQKKLVKQIKMLQKKLIKFKELVQIFRQQDNILDQNPLLYIFYLVCGIFFLIVSCIFFIHTILSLKGFYIILEKIFLYLTQFNLLVGLGFFMVINVYIGMAIIQGYMQLSSALSWIVGGRPFKLN